MMARKRSIERILIEDRFVTENQLKHARYIHGQTGERLEDILCRLEYLREEDVLAIWSRHLGIPIIDLTTFNVDIKVLRLVPQYIAHQYRLVPLCRQDEAIVVAVADPFNVLALDLIKMLLNSRIRPVLATRDAIQLAISQHYQMSDGSEPAARSDAQQTFQQEETDEEIEGSAIKFLDTVLKQAVQKKASDIHIEPDVDSFIVRMRIDGFLHDVLFGPRKLHAPVTSRLKLLAQLDITERRMPQDGRLLIAHENLDVSFRVSTVPTLKGEKAVLRVLSTKTSWTLDSIGLDPEELRITKDCLESPYGMVLVTGPTGSGKTTTLFAMLEYLNDPKINIFTIENPIEYKVKRITQVQTDDKIGLDFATGLRAALRQDPDVIMVGEIRDLETADVGLRSALTGHRVLSTVHTNNAAATVCRLVNMGCPPYLVSAALTLLISQKLLHTICPKCKDVYVPPKEVRDKLVNEDVNLADVTFYEGKGCVSCHYTGFDGRGAIYEVMPVDDILKTAILETNDELAIKRLALDSGMVTLREKAIRKAREGITTLTEVFSQTAPDFKRVSAQRSLKAKLRSWAAQRYHDDEATPARADAGANGPVAGAPGRPGPGSATEPSVRARPEAGWADEPPIGDRGESHVLSPVDLAFLKENFLRMTDGELASSLGIPLPRLRNIMVKLDLKREVDDLSGILNVD
ncbi:MAG: Flp pilus assembly complex ATPase component TadA [Candidatus Riflebacteria bacterium]|nr:Flp pilus assembly complex ATPase component TadA [Candidatus Riflebacteria bacterium]